MPDIRADQLGYADSFRREGADAYLLVEAVLVRAPVVKLQVRHMSRELETITLSPNEVVHRDNRVTIP